MADILFYAKERCQLRLPDGESEEIRVASASMTRDSALKLINEESVKLINDWLTWSRWAEQSKSPSAKPAVRAWLRTRCYALIASLIEIDADNVFEARMKAQSAGVRGLSSRNRFQAGLLALFARESAQKKEAGPEPLDFRERELLGKQLWHAFRHFVPPHFLSGFISEYATGKKRRRFSDPDYVEPGFKNWIIDRLSECGDCIELLDGEYPGEILDQVATRLGMADEFIDDEDSGAEYDDDDDDDDENDDDGIDWDIKR